MDMNDEKTRNRLFSSIKTSYRSIDWARNLTRSLTEEFAGGGYGANKYKLDTYINLMNQTVDAYTMVLVANRPRVMVNTKNPALQPFSKQYELAINSLIQEIGLDQTLRKWVMDAFFCVGIVKLHMAESGEVQINNDIWMDPGKPFASNISIDNFVYDLSATKFSKVKYAGDMYRIPFADLEQIAESLELIKDAVPTSKYPLDAEKMERFSRGTEVDSDEYEPMIDLADIWVPRDGMIYTFIVTKSGDFELSGPPIASIPWTGPELGPYELLGFGDVPENIMPSSPASHLSMMSRLANNLLRKQSRRAKAQKNVHLYEPGQSKSVTKIKSAGDDEFVESLTPADSYHTVSVGGVDPNTQAFLVNVLEMFDKSAGNLTAMLGLGAQSDTATQESLIHGAVNKKEANMQYRVVEGTARIVRGLGRMLWDDKFKVIQSRFEIEGAEGYSVDMPWTPEDRQGDFSDYDFEIDMFSMPYTSPNQKMQSVLGLITNFYAPLLPVLQSAGGTLNMQEITKFFAEMTNTPQLNNFIQFTSPSVVESDNETPASPPTTRNYVRKSVSGGGTPQAKSHASQMAWLGAGNEPGGGRE